IEPARDAKAGHGRGRVCALGALGVALWTLQHPYPGIQHDAQLYTLQALARLLPALRDDLFLRFGSQDGFTMFGGIYAAFISLWGLGPAAALLTLLFNAAFAAALVLLARRLLPAPLAIVGVALVCI